MKTAGAGIAAYCHRRYSVVADMLTHEGSCDARFIVQRQWQHAIEKAKRLEIFPPPEYR